MDTPGVAVAGFAGVFAGVFGAVAVLGAGFAVPAFAAGAFDVGAGLAVVGVCSEGFAPSAAAADTFNELGFF